MIYFHCSDPSWVIPSLCDQLTSCWFGKDVAEAFFCSVYFVPFAGPAPLKISGYADTQTHQNFVIPFITWTSIPYVFEQ